MDLSKLPKLSDTKAAAEAAGVDPSPEQAAMPVTTPGTTPGTTPVASVTPPMAYRAPTTAYPPTLGADVWISTVIGLLFVFLGMTFARFAVATLTHHSFDTGVEWMDPDPRAGQPVAYFELQGYTAWTDMGAFLFGLTLLLEAAGKSAVVLRPGTASRAVLAFAAVLTLASVGLNLCACGLLLHVGITPILSGLAVAFGGWILFDEVQTLSLTKVPVRLA